jgi:citrate lyase subunit beta/citryl-CoA lyase
MEKASCIPPVIHEVYTPSENEVRKALRIVRAAEDAAKKGPRGAGAVRRRRVDVPVIKAF